MVDLCLSHCPCLWRWWTSRRALEAWLLYAGLVGASAWAGHAVLGEGAWLESDRALYRVLNALDLGPVTALHYAARGGWEARGSGRS